MTQSNRKAAGRKRVRKTVRKKRKAHYLSSSVTGACPECGAPLHDKNIAEQINHLLDHGYALVHVGTETSRADDGSLWHSTVAVIEF